LPFLGRTRQGERRHIMGYIVAIIEGLASLAFVFLVLAVARTFA